MHRATVVVLTALVGFAFLAFAYRHDPVATWDEDVARWAAGHLPQAVEWAARPFSWIGGFVGITVLTIVVSVMLVRVRAWLDLGFLLAAVIGSQLVVALLKTWFDRPRPSIDPVVSLPASASFPSGHATSGAACVGAVAVLATERLPSRRQRRAVWACVIVLGVGIGASRVALGVHYVSDVLAGWCFGIAWLALCLLIRDAVGRWAR